jgi:hypothetical protein
MTVDDVHIYVSEYAGYRMGIAVQAVLQLNT